MNVESQNIPLLVSITEKDRTILLLLQLRLPGTSVVKVIESVHSIYETDNLFCFVFWYIILKDFCL